MITDNKNQKTEQLRLLKTREVEVLKEAGMRKREGPFFSLGYLGRIG